MKVLVTGGNGFGGRPIARRLAREAIDLRLLVRDAARVPQDLATRAEIVVGKVEDRDLMRRVMEGVNVVFHAAALVTSWRRDPGDFDRTNVDGLRNALDAARENGVEKFVYTSSFLALDELSPDCGDYHRTKRLAHPLAVEAKAIILYPGVVFGPGETREANFVGRMIHEYRHGPIAGIFAGGRPRWCFSYTEDVAEGHVLAWQRAQPGSRYILGGENIALTEFYRILAEESGVHRRLVPAPAAVVEMMGHASMLLTNLTGRSPSVTAEGVRLLARDWVFSSEAAEREIGYRITPFREALRRTLRASK